MSIFNQIKLHALPHSKFNLSHDVKLSMKIGDLVPILCQDIVPGDKWKIDSQVFARFAPLKAPILQRVDMYVHFFFVPYRLIWEDFESFISPDFNTQASLSSATSPVVPHLLPRASYANMGAVKGYFKVGSLGDYLGLPALRISNIPDSTSSENFNPSLLPFRAYQLIYNEYYRDENVVPEVEISKASGGFNVQQVSNLFTLRKRSWAKDYFTSALPWVQRGVDVELPLSGDADVFLDSSMVGNGSSPANQIYRDYGKIAQQDVRMPASFYGAGDGMSVLDTGSADSQTAVNPVWLDPNGTLKADLSNVSMATINDLRECIALQRWMELSARVGARYKEMLEGHFHVRSKDARLDRPEYLGGGKAPMTISETFQTVDSSIKPLGYIGGNGVGFGSSMSCRKFFDEHGLLLGILSFRPKASYMQGMPRYYMKKSRFDFYWPSFANLGEQPIMNNEIYFDPSNEFGVHPTDETPFGYTPRYAEYKFIPSSVHGDMLTSLEYWHLARKFSNQPLLNQSFLEVSGQDRIFAVNEETADHLYVQVFNQIRASRPMPKFGTPSII